MSLLNEGNEYPITTKIFVSFTPLIALSTIFNSSGSTFSQANDKDGLKQLILVKTV